MTDCQNCGRLEAEVQRLNAENTLLKEQLRLLLELLEYIRQMEARVLAEARGIMSETGVPRGRWSFAKGQADNCELVLSAVDAGGGVVSVTQGGNYVS